MLSAGFVINSVTFAAFGGGGVKDNKKGFFAEALCRYSRKAAVDNLFLNSDNKETEEKINK